MNKKLLFGIIGLLIVGATIVLFASNKSEPNNFKTHIDVSLTDEQKDNYNKAIAEVNGKLDAVKSQKNIPKDEVQSLYLQKGVLEYSLGNLSEAKEAYDSAAQIDPSNASVWAGIYPVLRDMGDLDKAEEAMVKVITLNPADWNTWRAYIEFEQYQRHASNDQLDVFYKQALDGTHMDLNIVTVYAQFLEQERDDLQSALNYWKIALEQQPNNKTYQSEIDRLKKILGQK